MQRPRDRITKKELKEDEFVTRAVQVSEYVQENYPKVLGAIGALVVVILIGIFIRDHVAQQDLDAVEAFGEARVALMLGNIDEATRLAERVRVDYSGKPAAYQATLLLGDIHFGQERWDEARSYYESYLDEYGPEGPGGYGASAGVAACIEELSSPADAAREYLAYVDQNGTSAFAPLALAEAARCLEASGDLPGSEAALRRIVDDYPDSQAARTAKSRLDLMGAKS